MADPDCIPTGVSALHVAPPFSAGKIPYLLSRGHTAKTCWQSLQKNFYIFLKKIVDTIEGLR